MSLEGLVLAREVIDFAWKIRSWEMHIKILILSKFVTGLTCGSFYS